jgi:hypothetical protein
MFRTGIWTVEQFLQAEKRPGRKSGTVSIRLSDVKDDAGPEEIRIFEAISGTVRTSNDTYRTTYPRRFTDLDMAAQIQLQRVFGPSDVFEIQDRAASTCLTSAEWAGVVFPFFRNVRFVASDRLVFLVEAALPSGEIFILEPGGEPLQYIRPPMVLRLVRAESAWGIALRPLLKHYRARLRGLRMPPDWVSEPNTRELLVPPWKLRRIPFTHPQARSLARADPRFRITTASVFDAVPGACQVLRTMNILNRIYFPEERIREGIRASLNSLTENGIWIVGRTIEEPRVGNHATIFQKRNGAFEVLDRIGDGWELEAWALSTG